MTRLLLSACVVVLVSSLTSCEVFRLERKQPAIPVQKEASWDGNHQDSGLLLVNPDKGALVTVSFVDRYNAMALVYHNDPRNVPPVEVGDGVTAATPAEMAPYPNRGQLYWMTQQALAKMIEMNTWRKAATPSAVKP